MLRFALVVSIIIASYAIRQDATKLRQLLSTDTQGMPAQVSQKDRAQRSGSPLSRPSERFSPELHQVEFDGPPLKPPLHGGIVVGKAWKSMAAQACLHRSPWKDLDLVPIRTIGDNNQGTFLLGHGSYFVKQLKGNGGEDYQDAKYLKARAIRKDKGISEEDQPFKLAEAYRKIQDLFVLDLEEWHNSVAVANAGVGPQVIGGLDCTLEMEYGTSPLGPLINRQRYLWIVSETLDASTADLFAYAKDPASNPALEAKLLQAWSASGLVSVPSVPEVGSRMADDLAARVTSSGFIHPDASANNIMVKLRVAGRTGGDGVNSQTFGEFYFIDFGDEYTEPIDDEAEVAERIKRQMEAQQQLIASSGVALSNAMSIAAANAVIASPSDAV